MAAKAKTTQLPASLAGIDVSGDDLIRSVVEIVLNELLEVQFSEQLGAGPYERSPERLGYRARYYRRSLVARVGKITLRVPRDRSRIWWQRRTLPRNLDQLRKRCPEGSLL